MRRTRTGILVMAVWSCLPAVAVQASETDPAKLYEAHCASCHNGGVPHAPHVISLQMMSSRAILEAMVSGPMQEQAGKLSDAERAALARHLGGTSVAETPPLDCGEDRRAFDRELPRAVDGWGLTLAGTRFIDGETAGLTADEVSGLELKWAFAYPGATRARSQPGVAAGAVFVGSQDGRVYALDLETGCVRWTFTANAEVRTAVGVSDVTAELAPFVYFGDFKGTAYAVDAFSGALLWRTKVEEHRDVTLTGSPRLYKGRIYVPLSSREWASAADPAYPCCTFRGGVVALDAATGRQMWKTYSISATPEPTGEVSPNGTPRQGPAGAPIWNSPTIDARRNRLYVGTGEAYTSPAAATSDAVLAMDLESGELAWHYQAIAGDAWNMDCFIRAGFNCPEEDGPDWDIGAPPVLVTLADGRDILLAGQKSGVIHALDPDQGGSLLWKKKIGRGGYAGGVHWGMAAMDGVLYAPNADTDFIGRWPGERKPGLFALDAATGEINWFTPAPDVCNEGQKPACDPGLSAAVTAIPGVVFAGGFDGHLRAYAAGSGEIIWDYDTNRAFESVSGAPAHGGSIESDGPVVAHGHVLVNSGYLFGGRMPGNVLLAFAVPGRADKERLGSE